MASTTDRFDVVIRGGTVYDGGGGQPVVADVAIRGDAIGAVEAGLRGRGGVEVDARSLAVAPGFINMLSWSPATLIIDGRSQSEIRQGVTLEVMGEGSSMGPLTPAMKQVMREQQGDLQYNIEWTTLGEYLDYVVGRGISTNVASFVGATTARVHVLGYEDRRPSQRELDEMRALVAQAMDEGAVGVSSTPYYAPASYADTEELVALAEVVAEDSGLYISHIRDEGARILEALDELITVARRAKVRAEIYHLKLSGKENWNKLDAVIAKIEQARAEGLHITADMYPYPASSTGLDALIPRWAHVGGHKALVERLKDRSVRERLKVEMRSGPRESRFNPEGTLLASFKSQRLKPLMGKRLSEVAKQRGTSPEDTVMDLIVEDDSRVGAIYFTMSEENVGRILALPWVAFDSDAGSMAPEEPFTKSAIHPRAYGTFARVLGKYVREERAIPLEEAIRKLTSFPAANLKIDRRGWLRPGYFADIVVFDPATIQDHATFERPHQYSTGVLHVFVNGTQVLKDGEHTNARPGRVVRGPGWRK